jgi:RNA polymerase sigma-70 factor, ECF subfamily
MSGDELQPPDPLAAASHDEHSPARDVSRADDQGVDPVPEFDLLALIDPDPVKAERGLEDLARRLRRFLEHECRDPADAVQEVFKRGITRLRAGVSVEEKGVAAYFFGIARNLIKENWKPKHRREQQIEAEDWAAQMSRTSDAERTEAVIELEQVLSQLRPDERELILRYVQEGPEQLAREQGRTVQNMRIIAFRIRERLRAERDRRRDGSAHAALTGGNEPLRRGIQKEAMHDEGDT